MTTDKPTVLAVDDMPSNTLIMGELLADDYQVITAESGEAALQIATHQPLDLVLLDVMMPGIDGFEVCRQLKQNPATASVPVVFITSLDAHDSVTRGLELGAYYYLTKPIDPEQLLAIAASATEYVGLHKRLKREHNQLLLSLALMDFAQFRFRTLEEVQDLAVLIANAFPSPETGLMGLTELMTNAVEHGNLGISYDEKTQLNNEGRWQEEVERRLCLPENLGKYALLKLEQGPTELRITIRDQGPGFDWENYLQISPERVFDNHGRGIAMAGAVSFDRIEYRGNGNEVVGFVMK